MQTNIFLYIVVSLSSNQFFLSCISLDLRVHHFASFYMFSSSFFSFAFTAFMTNCTYIKIKKKTGAQKSHLKYHEYDKEIEKHINSNWVWRRFIKIMAKFGQNSKQNLHSFNRPCFFSSVNFFRLQYSTGSITSYVYTKHCLHTPSSNVSFTFHSTNFIWKNTFFRIYFQF